MFDEGNCGCIKKLIPINQMHWYFDFLMIFLIEDILGVFQSKFTYMINKTNCVLATFPTHKWSLCPIFVGSI